jgi:hypothetical protein
MYAIALRLMGNAKPTSSYATEPEQLTLVNDRTQAIVVALRQG